ncbi:MAG TPA: J domain-containing protein [Anaerolineae bacterium]|nr:J domain-containing protein [Anaerolineae bacterium]
MEYRDYYHILGVPRGASDQEIKRAYRHLARELHPDRNPNNSRAEERFKQINEAYQVLGDPEKRAKYDRLGANWRQWERMGGSPQNFDFGQWFSSATGGTRPEHANVDDLVGERGGFSDFFQSIFGGGTPGPAGHRRQGQPAPPAAREQAVDVTLEEAYSGTSRVIQVDGRRVEASLPPGVTTGSRVRLALPGGDLFLRVNVLPHEAFTRQGDDLYRDLDVDVYTAVLGGQVRVPTLSGAVRLKVPPDTQGGRTFRIRAQGMPVLGDPKRKGDLFARVQIVIPEKIGERERALFRELRRLGESKDGGS